MNSDDGGVGVDAVVGVDESVQWERLDGTWLRVLRFAPQAAVAPGPRATAPVADASPHGVAVLVPGLGLPRYLQRLARHQASVGLETLVLDALAWRGRGQRAAPTIAGLSRVAAAWLQRRSEGPLVVVGHSTGAQVALEAVLSTQRTRPALSLVMGGPTFTPAQRRLRGLVPAALTAYLKDTPKELVVLKDVARLRTDLVHLVQSARRHPVDRRVPLLTVPLTVTAGEADSFAPADWLELLARRAGGPSRAVVLPGLHNNPFTYPEEFGGLVLEALDAARGGSDVRWAP